VVAIASNNRSFSDTAVETFATLGGLTNDCSVLDCSAVALMVS